MRMNVILVASIVLLALGGCMSEYRRGQIASELRAMFSRTQESRSTITDWATRLLLDRHSLIPVKNLDVISYKEHVSANGNKWAQVAFSQRSGSLVPIYSTGNSYVDINLDEGDFIVRDRLEDVPPDLTPIPAMSREQATTIAVDHLGCRPKLPLEDNTFLYIVNATALRVGSDDVGINGASIHLLDGIHLAYKVNLLAYALECPMTQPVMAPVVWIEARTGVVFNSYETLATL